MKTSAAFTLGRTNGSARDLDERARALLVAFFYGPQSRVMDGVLARADCLLIAWLR